MSGSEHRILFVGNSYTYFNDLPSMFASLAESMGRRVHVESSTAGGYRLSQHANPEDPIGSRTRKLLEEPWDYVILQEQSLGATTEKGLEGMARSLGVLDGDIRAHGGRPVLYMTWGRHHGRPEAGFPDYQSMQAAITDGYDRVGRMLGMDVAPVGLAWAAARRMDDGIGLWNDDESHPTPLGSLLAAYVIYGATLREDPSTGGYTAGLDGPSVDTIKAAALEVLTGRGFLVKA